MSKGHTHQTKHVQRSGKNNRELIYADSGANEMYGEVIQALGDCRFRVKIISNNQEVVARVRGALKLGKKKPNKQHIYPKSIVLILKDIETYHIMHSYTDEHVKQLKKSGEITEPVEITDINQVIFDDEEVGANNEVIINLDDI